MMPCTSQALKLHYITTSLFIEKVWTSFVSHAYRILDAVSRNGRERWRYWFLELNTFNTLIDGSDERV